MVKDWDEMTANEKCDLLRAKIQQLMNAVNATNFGLNDKIAKVDARLQARLKEVAKDVQVLREQVGVDA